MNKWKEEREDQGFTLIELLIAIVVVGILAAVAIVGIAGLTNTGGKSACTATADAAHAASAAYYANNDNKWPLDFKAMVDDKELELQSGVDYGATNKVLTNGDWNLTGTFVDANTPPVIDAKAAGNCKNP